jgi:hypothetical protein
MKRVEPKLIKGGLPNIEGVVYDLGLLTDLFQVYNGMVEFEGAHAVGMKQGDQIVMHPRLFYKPS